MAKEPKTEQNKKTSWMYSKKEDSQVSILENDQKDEVFSKIPSSPMTALLYRAMGAGKSNIYRMKNSTTNHSKKINVASIGSEVRVKQETDNSIITASFSNIDDLVGCNKAVKKIFVYALEKINGQVIFNNELKSDAIEFTLQDLVYDVGMYKSVRTARKGFLDARDALTSIKIKGEVRKRGKNKVIQDRLEVLFTGASIENSKCTLYLNPRLNWKVFTTAFMPLPKFYYSRELPNKASDLLFCIYYFARQHKEDIEEKGYFTISLKVVHEWLNLPEVHETKNPGRNIVDKIDEAITAIELASNSEDFTITPIFDDSGTIECYLKKGYLKIGMKGEYAKDIVKLAKKVKKRKENAKKRNDAIVDKAKTLKLAKKMEDEEKARANNQTDNQTDNN